MQSLGVVNILFLIKEQVLWRDETANDAQGGRLAAATGSEQREELTIVKIQINAIENKLVVKRHAAIHKANQLFGHLSSPIPFLTYKFLRGKRSLGVENCPLFLSYFPKEKQAHSL